MNQTADIGHFPDQTAERIQFAKDWWNSDAFRLLPGEADD